ncbi:hypothetical protein JCM10449v2_006465 [Rhodotorula kratochvilovae]
MHGSEQLLTWLQEIYDWLVAFSAPGYTPDAAVKTQLEESKAAFFSTWWEFLPAERESIVDVLLARYCWMCAVGSIQVDTVLYIQLRGEAGVAPVPMHPVHDPVHPAAYGYVHTIVGRIVALYANTTSDNLVHDVEQAEEARQWADNLLCPMGLDPVKVGRLEPAACDRLVSMLSSVERRLGTLQRAPAGMPAVQLALPNAESLLLQAQLAVRTPERRAHLFRNFLSSFSILYAVGNSSNPAPVSIKFAQAKIMSDAVQTTKGPTALTHFIQLPVALQQHAVTRAREILVTTCRDFAERKELPDASRIPNPMPLNSLARAPTPLQQISDRKARRYYGTTARAWEARRAAGGL